MSVTFGFYNSVNHDRLYNATQMSKLFDGILRDGVLMSIEKQLIVKVGSGMRVLVQPGRAWFNRTWTYNDTDYPIDLPAAELVLDRYDAIVLQVDERETFRANSLICIKGTPGVAPTYPTMINDDLVHQYPLAYIFVKNNTVEIQASDITNCVGSSECPFATGILETAQLDDLFVRWQNQWDRWYSQETQEAEAIISSFTTSRTSDFDEWYEDIKNSLGDDPATALAARISELESSLGKSFSYQSIKLNAKSDTSVAGYSWSQAIKTLGVTKNTFAIVSFRDPDSYDGKCQISTETKDDYIYLFFSEQPTKNTIVDIYWSTTEADTTAIDNLQAQITEISTAVKNLQNYVPTKLANSDIKIGQRSTFTLTNNHSWKEGDYIHININIDTGESVIPQVQSTVICSLPAEFTPERTVKLVGYMQKTGQFLAFNSWVDSSSGTIYCATTMDIPANTELTFIGSYTR